jgi:hypothetical protein
VLAWSIPVEIVTPPERRSRASSAERVGGELGEVPAVPNDAVAAGLHQLDGYPNLVAGHIKHTRCRQLRAAHAVALVGDRDGKLLPVDASIGLRDDVPVRAEVEGEAVEVASACRLKRCTQVLHPDDRGNRPSVAGDVG